VPLVYVLRKVNIIVMGIRYGNYTRYKNHDVELFEARHETPTPFTHLILKWVADDVCPYNEFIETGHGSLTLTLKREDVKNGFYIITKAIYKGAEFVIQPYYGDNIHLHIATKDKTFRSKLNFHELYDSQGQPYYLAEIKKNDIEKLWEERSKSTYDLAMPEGLEFFKELNLT
jgi:hypothetical protein